MGAVYLFGFWSLAGQTPGMRFVGIRLSVHRLPPRRSVEAPDRPRPLGHDLRHRLPRNRLRRSSGAAGRIAFAGHRRGLRRAAAGAGAVVDARTPRQWPSRLAFRRGERWLPRRSTADAAPSSDRRLGDCPREVRPASAGSISVRLPETISSETLTSKNDQRAHRACRRRRSRRRGRPRRGSSSPRSPPRPRRWRGSRREDRRDSRRQRDQHGRVVGLGEAGEGAVADREVRGQEVDALQQAAVSTAAVATTRVKPEGQRGEGAHGQGRGGGRRGRRRWRRSAAGRG